jgi:two-component system nitrate/nitrite response regulator NarL
MRRRQSFATILVGKSVLLREGLARILRSANFRILASVACADDLLPSKLQRHQPLFLIVHTGDDFEAAVEQIELFRDQHLSGRIAIVADHYRLDDLVSAFRAGAHGYFVDVMTCDALIKSIELVMMGETIFPPALLSLILGAESDRHRAAVSPDESNQAILVTTEDPIAPQLSPREKLILRCLIDGDSNKCIARKIDIAEATVKVHVKAILRKIRVQNRTQAAIWGMNNGSLARTANNQLPLSTSDVNKRLPNPVGEMPQIKQIDAPVPLGVIDHEAIQLGVPRTNGLLRELKTEGGIRLRK